MWMAESESETFLNDYDFFNAKKLHYLHKNVRKKVNSKSINEHDFDNVIQYSNGTI